MRDWVIKFLKRQFLGETAEEYFERCPKESIFVNNHGQTFTNRKFVEETVKKNIQSWRRIGYCVPKNKDK